MRSVSAAVAVFLLLCAAKPRSLPPLHCLDERGRPSPDATQPLRFDESITRPKLVQKGNPFFREYPQGRGAIVIESIIDHRGRICAARLVKGSGPFAEAALASLKEWRFEPARKDGKPVPVFYTVTFNFCPR